MRPSAPKKLVAIVTFCLLAWFLVLQGARTATPQSRLILWTGVAFAALIMVRRNDQTAPAPPSDGMLAGMAGGGSLLAIAGTVVGVHQFQWLGILLLAFAGFRWSLPRRYAVNTAPALFVLYWAHPLPGNLFGTVRMGMQRLSVLGAEWCLHTFKVPVWADGLILRTGFRSFEVPEACSGMTTAMIVVVCALGSGALLRLSVPRQLVLMGAGFAQVLVANAMRIALMVGLARGTPPGWADQFLHASTSALLLVMIALIQGEAFLWSWTARQIDIRKKRLRADLIPSPGSGPLVDALDRWLSYRLDGLKARPRANRFLQYVFGRVATARVPRFGTTLLVVVLLLATLPILTLLTQRRPARRAQMIARVAEELAQHDLEQAELAAQAAAALAPGSLEEGVMLARIQLMRGKHEQALLLMRALQPVPRDDIVIQLTAWGLLGSGQLEEAEALLSHLPPALAIHPGIAMCAAELALRQGDADRAASSVVIAASWPTLSERVRRTYPFLAQHGKWEAIVRSNDPSPYRNPELLRIALVATMAENALSQTSQLLENNRALWSGKPTFLPHLRELALRHSDASWLRIFADSLIQCMDQLSPDELTSCFESCFMLGRPDLAWLAYDRLSRLDPLHPALALIPAQFAENWYVFRGEAIGWPVFGSSLLNLRAFFRVSARCQPYRRFLETVPLGRLMLAGPTPARVSAWTKDGLTELARRQTHGDLSYEGYALYERSLQWAGLTGETLGILDDMERRFPERRVEILALRGKYYRSRNEWQSLYEILRQVRALRPHLDRDMQLMLAETLIQIDMGVCALEVNEAALNRRPDDRAARLMLASLWERFGFTEESLFVLRPLPSLPPSEALAALLGRSGRHDEAAVMNTLIGKARADAFRPQALPRLPPAENVLVWGAQGGNPPPFSAASLERQIREDTSPFLRALHQMTRDWLKRTPRERRADIPAWKGIGRDTMEQVTALHRLAFLAAQDGDLPGARLALDDALQLMPSARLLWRMRIAVAGPESETMVVAARRACPADPEIWLAALVTHLRNARKDVAITTVKEAGAQDRYSPATLVRAGYALLRAGEPAAAGATARTVLTKSRHYLPACLLGLDAALASRNADDAAACALQIADSAPDPAPFLEIAVRLGMTRETRPTSLTRALETLIALQPDQPEWPLRLGTLHYENNLFQMARDTFGRWLLHPPAGTDPNLLIMMAESARRSGELPDSLAVLREAFRRHPEHLNVINSLAWTLAQKPATLGEAEMLLPRLTNAAPTASVLDTVAMIYLKSGKVDAAQRTIKEALEKLQPGDSLWTDVHLSAAEIECAKGRAPEAEKLLKATYDRRRPDRARLDPRITALETRINALKKGLYQ